MQPCSREILSVLSLNNPSSESLSSLLNHERTRFLEYASSEEIRLQSNEKISPEHIKSLQTLTLPMRCYAVEFNGDLVTISLLK
ncbi:MAG: hypothetical protein PHO27_07095 [Sulfuricurvum sp.]|nr:hypothetical protein [Sulfuricurvum sp.]